MNSKISSLLNSLGASLRVAGSFLASHFLAFCSRSVTGKWVVIAGMAGLVLGGWMF